MLQKDMKRWSGLSSPYNRIVEGVNKLKKDARIIIITNKNKGSVFPQAGYFGLDIAEDDIYDTYISNNKREKLEMISKKFDVPFRDIIFVDDMLEHLVLTKSLGIKPMLAIWFNKNKKMQKEAKKLGIPLLTEENFYEKIKEALK